RGKDQGRQTVPEQWRGNRAQRNDLAIAKAEPSTAAKRKQSCLCEAPYISRPPWMADVILFLVENFCYLNNLCLYILYIH
ncbi:MAG: hypothetical protein LBB78_11035, partial [Spirochaetaceae bacterium]|nr:hypothetical protein [Spirochaetaceae bacterium]